jgi:uncharacterized membrane protein
MKSGNLAGLTSKLRKLLLLVYQRLSQIWKALRAKPYLALLFVAILIYGIVFSYFTVMKHNAFQSYTWDLGIFNQAMYTTLHNGSLFYYTAELFFSVSGSYFAVHFSPILFLALPFYAIGSSPITLLVIQSFSLALGAFPLYLLAGELLKSKKAAFLIAVVYFLYPALQGANWYDFHAPAFLPLLFFSMCYFMVTHRWKLFFPCMLLTLMIQEQVAFTVFIFGAYYFVKSGHFKSLLKSSSPLRMTENLAAAVALIASVIYYVAASYIRNSFPVNPKYVELLKATSAYSVLGLKGDPLLFPVYIILSPQNAFNALAYDFPIKIFYLFLLFGPLLFVPFKSKLTIAILGLLSFFLFSNYLGWYEIGNQYPLYSLPLIFIAAIYGLRKLKIQNVTRVLQIMLVASLLFAVAVSPLSPLAKPLIKEGALWYPFSGLPTNENANSLSVLVNLIPPSASVLTQNTVFPHVSGRMDAYVLPLDNVANDTEYLNLLIHKSEYVLLDLSAPDPATIYTLNTITQNNTYGAYALGTSAILFRRSFQGEPLFAHYNQDRTFAAYKDLFLSSFSQTVTDPSAADEKAVLCPKGTAGYFLYGPYTYLLPGTYEVSFEVKTDAQISGVLGGCDIAGIYVNSSVTKRDILGSQLKPNEWTNLTISLTPTRLTTAVEFRAFSNGTADIYVNRVFVHRVGSDLTSNLG